MFEKIIIEVDYFEAMAIRTALSYSEYDIRKDIEKVQERQAQGLPTILADYSYEEQIEFYMERLQRVLALLIQVDNLIDKHIDSI